MKKIYNVFFCLNILCGIIMLINYEFIFNYSRISLPITIGFIFVYAIFLFLYFKRDNNIGRLEITTTSIYILFLLIILLFSIIYQTNNSYTYNMLYFTKILILPHFIYIIFNCLKNK